MVTEDIKLTEEPDSLIDKIDKNEYIENQIRDVLSKVEQVLDLGGIEIIKKYFDLNGLKNYFDFYYLKIDDFKNILGKSEKLTNFYKNKTGESFSHISHKNMLYFAEFLGFEKLNYFEVKKYITDKLKVIGVESKNELKVISINNFIDNFFDDKIFKYFFKRVIKTSIHNISQENYDLFSEKIGLITHSDIEVKFILKEKLKLKGISSLDDLEKNGVRNFSDLVGECLLLEYYFISKGIFKSFIKKEDINNFGLDIGLKNINFDSQSEIKNFLRSNHIFTYDDLVEFHKTEIRSILWENPVCRKILNGFGLTLLKDYRLEHLKRFSRFVGLEGVPKDFELDELKSKDLILKRLELNGINCLYSLKLNGIKGFKRIFKESLIGKIYIDINSYIKNNLGKTIVNLLFDDLDSVGILLGLPVLSEQDHKSKFLYFLSLNGLELDKLNKTKVKNDRDFWRNPNFRYLLEQVSGPTDIKLLRPNHIDDLIKLIEEI